MSAQERYDRYKQLALQALAQNPIPNEQLVAFAFGTNQIPVKKSSVAAGFLLAGGPGMALAELRGMQACLIVATNQQILFIGMSKVDNYKPVNRQAYPLGSVQVLSVKRTILWFTKVATLMTPTGQLWINYTPGILVSKFDPVLDYIRQHQTVGPDARPNDTVTSASQ